MFIYFLEFPLSPCPHHRLAALEDCIHDRAPRHHRRTSTKPPRGSISVSISNAVSFGWIRILLSLVLTLLSHKTVRTPHTHELQRILHPPGEHHVCRMLQPVQFMMAKVLAIVRVSFVDELSQGHTHQHPGCVGRRRQERGCARVYLAIDFWTSMCLWIGISPDACVWNWRRFSVGASE